MLESLEFQKLFKSIPIKIEKLKRDAIYYYQM